MLGETSITNPQMGLVMRNGLELWLDKEKAMDIGESMLSSPKGIMRIDGRFINAVDIIGIFTPQDLEDYHKVKRGQWRCKYGNWHSRDENCECARNMTKTTVMPDYEQTPEQRAKAREAIDKVRAELDGKL